MADPLTLNQIKEMEADNPVKEELEAFLAPSKNWGSVDSFIRQEENPNPAESEPLDEVELTEELASEVLESSVRQVWGS
jgi:hypothetical protein